MTRISRREVLSSMTAIGVASAQVLRTPSTKPKKVIIAGGGIGGLTTALMLRARGISCELYEQSDTIRELGVGINTLPHDAVRPVEADDGVER